MNKIIVERIKDYFFISLGTLIIASAFANFIIPLGISAGGASGIATVLYLALNLHVVVGITIINVILLIASFFVLDRDVFYRSIYGTLLFPVCIAIIPPVVPIPLTRPLDVVIFSSLIMGIGFVFVFKYRGSTGGTSIFPYFFKKFLGIPMAVGFFITDLAVVSLNLFLNNVEGFLYGSLYIFLSNVVIYLSQDYILRKLKLSIYTNNVDTIHVTIDKYFQDKPSKYFFIMKGSDKLSIIILALDYKKLSSKLLEIDRDIKVEILQADVENIVLDPRYK